MWAVDKVDYTERVRLAPAGWQRFSQEDMARLPAAVRRHELACVPAEELDRIMAGDPAAIERQVRAMFWPFIYHLEPQLWDALASVEPIHPEILRAIRVPDGTVVDIGAGSGRLTRFLARSASNVVAVEPSAGLCQLLRARLPAVRVVRAWAEALPLRSRSIDMTAACGTLGPDARVLSELKRVTRPGGEILLISPEQPEWFEAAGWQRLSCPSIPPLPHAAWIDELFGPPDPPHQMFVLRV